jgi:NADPH:quinone reductase
MKALYFTRFGGPEVLEYGDLRQPSAPRDGAIVRLTAIGLNFADVYRRRGNYHLAGAPPYVAGYEGAGVVETTGRDAPEWLRPGLRVGFADSPFANAQFAAVEASRAIPLPDDVDDETAAAILLQGLTAQYLVRDSRFVRAGERVVVHAAAGGVGLLLVQILKILGAYVIALSSSDEKLVAAKDAGADETGLYDRHWPAIAKNADVIYDSVGSTLDASLDAVRNGGTVVFYGMSGGDPQPVDPRRLMDGSKTLSGGDLWNVLTTHEERVRRASELFGWVRSGQLRVRIARRFPLSEGAQAHAFLESRKAIGKVLLIP